MLGQDRFFPRLLGWRKALVGSLLTLASGALFLFDIAEVFVLRPRWLHVPLAAAAEVVFVVIVLISSLATLRTSFANSKTRLSVRSHRRFEPVAHPDSRIGRSS